MVMNEAIETFPCFGSTCAVLVLGDAPGRAAVQAAEAAKQRLLAWHDRFTRFTTTSELARLNADPRPRVPVSPEMALLVEVALRAADETGGLVDAALLREIEDAGYRGDRDGEIPLRVALDEAPPRRPAHPSANRRWRHVGVDSTTVMRPPGLAFDAGGLVKGLVADLLAAELREHASFAIDAAGDLRLGGAGNTPREVRVASPFDGSTLHTFRAAQGGFATSGIGRRAWRDATGAPAHHLLDPSTGRPAYTGIVQATALAPTAVEAEVRAKAAVLSGPEAAPDWLPHGGVLVFDDGGHVVLPARAQAEAGTGTVTGAAAR